MLEVLASLISISASAVVVCHAEATLIYLMKTSSSDGIGTWRNTRQTVHGNNVETIFEAIVRRLRIGIVPPLSARHSLSNEGVPV